RRSREDERTSSLARLPGARAIERGDARAGVRIGPTPSGQTRAGGRRIPRPPREATSSGRAWDVKFRSTRALEDVESREQASIVVEICNPDRCSTAGG